VEAFAGAHCGQQVAGGSFAFLDQIQKADETWARTNKGDISISEIYIYATKLM